MSTVACSKDYTITINPAGPPVEAYWTLNETTGDRVDSVNGLHLFLVGFPVSDGVPALISNGLLTTDVFNGDYDTFNSSQLRLQSNTGFSSFGWFKINGHAAVARGPLIAINFTGGQRLYLDLANSNNPGNVHIYWQDSLFNSNDLYTNVTEGAFHFFHAFYNPSTTRVGYSIDNGAQVLDAPGAIFASGATGDYQLLPANAAVAPISVLIDEVGLRLDRMLTSAEVTFLYNSGAGRTWPLTGFP